MRAAVADRLGIPFYVINAEEPFKREVVRPLHRDVRGRPDAESVPGLQPARSASAICWTTLRGRWAPRYLATGHYARIRRGADGPLSALARRRSGQGSVLRPERAGAGRSGAGAVSGGRVHQAAGARPGRRARPADRVARSTARTCASSPTGTTAASWPTTRRKRCDPARSSTPAAGSWAYIPACRPTRSASGADWASPRRSRSTFWRWTRRATH